MTSVFKNYNFCGGSILLNYTLQIWEFNFIKNIIIIIIIIVIILILFSTEDEKLMFLWFLFSIKVKKILILYY